MLLLVFLTGQTRAVEDDYAGQDRQYYGKLEIDVWVDKGEDASYEPGEDVRVYFKTNLDAYVIIYNVDTRGYVHLLYPYDYRDSRFVEAHRPYRIPSLTDDYYLKVNGPQGTEMIVALVTRQPFPVPNLGWNLEYDYLTEEDYYYMRKLEGEDVWDFVERLNHRIVPDHINYELDITSFRVEPRYPKRYYTEPSFYFSYYDYPYWYRPQLYFGAVYFDYPYHAEIYIDGIFFGYAPLHLPYFLYGRHYVTVYHHGYLVYRDYCYVRAHDYLRIRIPQDRIYKHYSHRYAKDYRLIKNKPEIFWTKVRELNTKYKYTPAIKDDFTLKNRTVQKTKPVERFAGRDSHREVISKEKQFRSRLHPTGGEELARLEQVKLRPDKSARRETPERKLRQEKRISKEPEYQTRYERSSSQDSKERAYRKEIQKQETRRTETRKESTYRKPNNPSQKVERIQKVERSGNSGKSTFRKEVSKQGAGHKTVGRSGNSAKAGKKSKK
jgi:hypothetical protein